MKQLVTANVASNLYWLGRNLERAQETLYRVSKAYDLIIDVDRDAGIKLYKKFDIELKYDSAIDFLRQAILGEHRANMLEITANARESAIISRHRIDSEAFGEIIELHALFASLIKSDKEIDYKLIDNANSLISEIWGALGKREHTNKSDLFIRMGKLVEEADFRLRFKQDKKITKIVIKEIDAIVKTLSDEKPQKAIKKKKENREELLNEINSKINQVIVE